MAARMRMRRAGSLTALCACVLACWPAAQAAGATTRRHEHTRPLVLAQSGVMMRLPSFRLDGRRHEYTITIHPIQITDERSASGWRLVAAISQFSGIGGAFRAAAVVRPHCDWAGGSQWSAVASGPAQHLGGRPAWLCAAVAGTVASSTLASSTLASSTLASSTLASSTGAGRYDGMGSRLFDVSATLTVTIPAYVAVGRYSAIVTFTLLAKPGI